MPRFSVIIPLYNKENFIKNTIKSVLNQTFTDFELIIVDDCSTDGSLSEIKSFTNTNVRIIEHDVNKGLSASRNTGILNSNAEYVTFLDADDLWKENFLYEINKLIKEFPLASLYATNYEEIDVNNKIVLPKNGSDKLPEKSQIDDFFRINIMQSLYNLSGFCVKKNVFNDVGMFNTAITFGEDIDFNIRANLKFKLAYSNVPLTSYIVHSQNQITQGKLSPKTITNFDFYEQNNPGNSSLKKFLDFQRYTKAKQYKIENNSSSYKKMIKQINLSNLTLKQKILLFSPAFLLKMIKKVKTFLLVKGFRVTSY
ncbi:glycosyltransferase family 2 protein [Flavobacterium sp. UBA6135]|uniref:glycosyltransferase family 2 protein n=1 Tax=Flavobacterium sp. UBA6135 TaxID=1946553 RepID=UPI0025BE09FC|nr:glycosyltransferase family 2 protein [Flavobacterium sp. UBA6135]